MTMLQLRINKLHIIHNTPCLVRVLVDVDQVVAPLVAVESRGAPPIIIIIIIIIIINVIIMDCGGLQSASPPPALDTVILAARHLWSQPAA